jgi:predicted nucleic acid-binding protein
LVIVNAIRGERIYLDTNIFIYAIEGYPDFVDELNQLFDSIDAGNFRAFTSELTLAEVLVRPLMDANLEIQAVNQKE